MPGFEYLSIYEYMFLGSVSVFLYPDFAIDQPPIQETYITSTHNIHKP